MAGQFASEVLIAPTELEVGLLELAHELILQTMEQGFVVLDSQAIVVQENQAMKRMWGLPKSLLGLSLHSCALAEMCPPLQENLRQSLEDGTPAIQFKHETSENRIVQISIKPLWMADGTTRAGTLIYMAEVSSSDTSRSVNDALRTTRGALETANEELETANEQLQLTNEELETTIEELQTTNEELQTLNEELETSNEELANHSTAIDEMNLHYREMLQQIPWPVFLLSGDLRILLWSTAAQRLLGFSPRKERELRLGDIAFPVELRQTLMRRHESAIKTNRSSIIRHQPIGHNGSSDLYDIHLKPLPSTSQQPGVLLVFEKSQENVGPAGLPTRLEERSGAKQKASKTSN